MRWVVRILVVVVLALGLVWFGSWWSDHHPGTEEAIDTFCPQLVIVSNRDIPPGTDLDPLIAAKDFHGICVPNGAVVEGTVVSVDELRDRTTSQAIHAGEQIPVARLDTAQN